MDEVSNQFLVAKVDTYLLTGSKGGCYIAELSSVPDLGQWPKN